MGKITVVTAFFDIGRGDFNIVRCAPRSAQKYIDYFEFWARIQNDMIVYTSKEYKQQVLNIRKKFGREIQTTVIEVENIFDVEPQIFEKMKDVENNNDFKNFRFWNSEVSNRADYNYIMLMKYWCMADAVQKKLTGETVFWIDFGYNHGGDCYTNPEEFNFELLGKANNKIQLYCLPGKNPENTHSALSLQYQVDTICGSPIVAPQSLCAKLWDMTKNAMLSLISLDCIDDDQQLLLMSYKLYPELFEIHNSDWFMPLKEFWGGAHLTVKEKTVVTQSKRHLYRRVLGKLKRFFFSPKRISQKEDFLERTNKIITRYYK